MNVLFLCIVFVFFFVYMYVCSIPYFFKWVKLRDIERRKIQEILETVQQWKPQALKNESIENFVVILVNQKSYCVTSCVTKDMLCYFVWVMNFNFVWKSHIKTPLDQSISIAITLTTDRRTWFDESWSRWNGLSTHITNHPSLICTCSICIVKRARSYWGECK